MPLLTPEHHSILKSRTAEARTHSERFYLFALSLLFLLSLISTPHTASAQETIPKPTPNPDTEIQSLATFDCATYFALLEEAYVEVFPDESDPIQAADLDVELPVVTSLSQPEHDRELTNTIPTTDTSWLLEYYGLDSTATRLPLVGPEQIITTTLDGEPFAFSVQGQLIVTGDSGMDTSIPRIHAAYERGQYISGPDFVQLNRTGEQTCDPAVYTDHLTARQSLILGKPTEAFFAEQEFLQGRYAQPYTLFETKVLNETGNSLDGFESPVVRSALFAGKLKANFLLLSVGGVTSAPVYIDRMVTALQYAEAQGVILIFAAGNDNDFFPQYAQPACLPDLHKKIITHGLDEQDGEYFMWQDSNYHCTDTTSYNVAGPGARLPVRSIDDTSIQLWGTSLVPDQVATIMSLLAIQQPNMSDEELIAHFFETATTTQPHPTDPVQVPYILFPSNLLRDPNHYLWLPIVAR